MHLRHVRPPQDHAVGIFDVVVVAGRLVGAEDAVERGHGAGHAVAGIGVDVVGAEARLEQLVHGVALLHRPLPGAEAGDAAGAFLGIGLAELPLHLVEGLLPGHRHELALLVELTVLHAHERLGEAVLAVLDLAVEVALDAVQAPVDRRIRIALGGDDLAVLGRHHDAAAGAAEATHRLVPLPARLGGLDGRLGLFRDRQAHRGCGTGGDAGLQKITA